MANEKEICTFQSNYIGLFLLSFRLPIVPVGLDGDDQSVNIYK